MSIGGYEFKPLQCEYCFQYGNIVGYIAGYYETYNCNHQDDDECVSARQFICSNCNDTEKWKIKISISNK